MADETDQQTEQEQEERENADRNPEAEMPFLDHLEELRWRIIKSLVGIVLVGIFGYIFSDQILAILRIPADRMGNPFNLQILKVPDMFMVKIKIGIFTGMVGALPVITYQMWKFIAPGLLPTEKRYVPATVTVITICFLVGAVFGYFLLLPVALEFLTGLGLADIENNFALDAYVSFVTRIILLTGIIFELPVLSFFLTKIGLITPAVLKSIRRYAVIVIFVAAAFLTPPDPASMVMMGVPILLLYEISIWVSFLALPKETRQALKKARKERKQRRKNR